MPLSEESASAPRVTTTHDPMGGGVPRLIFSSGGREGLEDGGGASKRPMDFELLRGVTTIGSGSTCDLQLEGLTDQQVEIRRDDADEYVFVATDPSGESTVNVAPTHDMPLHTGDRLTLGPWVLSFFREEFADHGRPHGGRQGGEGSHQQPQAVPRKRGTSGDGASLPTDNDPGEYA